MQSRIPINLFKSRLDTRISGEIDARVVAASGFLYGKFQVL